MWKHMGWNAKRICGELMGPDEMRAHRQRNFMFGCWKTGLKRRGLGILCFLDLLQLEDSHRNLGTPSLPR